MNEREERGLTIAAVKKLTKKGNVWLVPSSAGTSKYTVSPHLETPHCTCADHELRGCKCKHIYAVEFAIKREEDENGVITETRSITISETRKTYPQKWSAYNAAQTQEKTKFLILLRDLCAGIPDRPKTKGRQWIPLKDAIFAAVYKVYSAVSGRRFMSDLSDAQAKGYIGKVPHFNSIFNVLENEDVSAILKALVEKSAAPLAAVETTFACDSSGFSGSRFDKWFDHKWGDIQCRRVWCKAHITCGVKTNIVTAIEIEGQHASDMAQMPALLETTRKQFEVKEWCADMGYISAANLQLVENAGAKPLIPFKSNATDKSGGIWAKCFHYFQFQKDEFLSRYHQRSNVESTFSMVKAKFGDSVRSKGETAMRNETYAKFLCHNICCLISAMFELGIEPVFPELN
jgi:hypothetical protein